jgi:hypothetical protein
MYQAIKPAALPNALLQLYSGPMGSRRSMALITVNYSQRAERIWAGQINHDHPGRATALGNLGRARWPQAMRVGR